MVTVVVVRAEAEVGGDVDVDAELLTRFVGSQERRLGEHAAEVEENGLDGSLGTHDVRSYGRPCTTSSSSRRRRSSSVSGR